MEEDEFFITKHRHLRVAKNSSPHIVSAALSAYRTYVRSDPRSDNSSGSIENLLKEKSEFAETAYKGLKFLLTLGIKFLAERYPSPTFILGTAISVVGLIFSMFGASVLAGGGGIIGTTIMAFGLLVNSMSIGVAEGRFEASDRSLKKLTEIFKYLNEKPSNQLTPALVEHFILACALLGINDRANFDRIFRLLSSEKAQLTDVEAREKEDLRKKIEVKLKDMYVIERKIFPNPQLPYSVAAAASSLPAVSLAEDEKLLTPRKRQAYHREKVLANEDSAYVAYGIRRQEAVALLQGNLKNPEVVDLLKPALWEALLNPAFGHYLVQQNIITAQDQPELGQQWASYAKEEGIVKAFIDFHVQEKKGEKKDGGWADASILRALACIQEVDLRLWRPDSDGKTLVPHRDVEFNLAQYVPENPQRRVDLLLTRENHFDQLKVSPPPPSPRAEAADLAKEVSDAEAAVQTEQAAAEKAAAASTAAAEIVAASEAKSAALAKEVSDAEAAVQTEQAAAKEAADKSVAAEKDVSAKQADEGRARETWKQATAAAEANAARLKEAQAARGTGAGTREIAERITSLKAAVERLEKAKTTAESALVAAIEATAGAVAITADAKKTAEETAEDSAAAENNLRAVQEKQRSHTASLEASAGDAGAGVEGGRVEGTTVAERAIAAKAEAERTAKASATAEAHLRTLQERQRSLAAASAMRGENLTGGTSDQVSETKTESLVTNTEKAAKAKAQQAAHYGGFLDRLTFILNYGALPASVAPDLPPPPRVNSLFKEQRGVPIRMRSQPLREDVRKRLADYKERRTPLECPLLCPFLPLYGVLFSNWENRARKGAHRAMKAEVLHAQQHPDEFVIEVRVQA